MNEQEYLEHYQNALTAYFSDRTEEGRIFKRAKLEEIEYVLRNIFQVKEDMIHFLYDQAYWLFQKLLIVRTFVICTQNGETGFKLKWKCILLGRQRSAFGSLTG